MAAGQSYQLETKLRRLEQSAKTRFGGTTDSELSELEDVVALTAARVQSAESEVGRHAVELSHDWFTLLSVGNEEIHVSSVRHLKTKSHNTSRILTKAVRK